MTYYVYILRCQDKSLYTGFTRNIKKRIREHNNSKKGAKALRGKLPVKLVYQEKFDNMGSALRRENEIKGFRKSEKEKLVTLKGEVLKRE